MGAYQAAAPSAACLVVVPFEAACLAVVPFGACRGQEAYLVPFGAAFVAYRDYSLGPFLGEETCLAPFEAAYLAFVKVGTSEPFQASVPVEAYPALGAYQEFVQVETYLAFVEFVPFGAACLALIQAGAYQAFVRVGSF